MTPPLNLDELEAKARAATPPDCDSRDIHPGNPVWGPRLAKFREAATPEAVTALCARVRELEEQVRKHIKLCEAAGRVLARWAPTDSIDKEVWNYCNDALGNGTKEALAVLSPNSIILRALLAKEVET